MMNRYSLNDICSYDLPHDVRDNSHSPTFDDGKLKYSFTVNLESPHFEIPQEYYKYNPRREDIKI